MKPTVTALMLLASFAAAQPNVAPRLDLPKARQFDFWIGEWDVANWWWQKGGTWVKAGDATCKVYAVLGGAAIIEHWQGNMGQSFKYGFSARAYDRRKQKWVLVLNWPNVANQTGFGTLEGAFTHGRGEFYSSFRTPDGKEGESRFSFSDISREKFRWDSARTTDGRRTWHTNWVMRFKRRPQDAKPLPNGPSLEGKLSTLPVARQFDFLKGRFRGEGRLLGDDGEWKTLQVRAEGQVILEGLGVQTEVTIGEQGYYGVYAYDGRVPSWVGYSLSKQDPRFQAAKGGKTDAGMTMTDDGEHASAWSWTDVTDEGYSVERREADKAGKLRTVFSARLERRE